MTLIHGDCIEVMAAMDPESVDAIVTDPPYGLEFMGKEWDSFKPSTGRGAGGQFALGTVGGFTGKPMPRHGKRWQLKRCATCGHTQGGGSPCHCPEPQWVTTAEPGTPAFALAAQEFHYRWAEAAYRVAKPSAYFLAFGGTRTVHRMTVALEDAGWIIRDMLVWAYASGFPKSKASLKPAWEPIVMARKPGPLRMLAIDECRIGEPDGHGGGARASDVPVNGFGVGGYRKGDGFVASQVGRWPANIILTDPIFDGGVEGVVGGTSEQSGGGNPPRRLTDDRRTYGAFAQGQDTGLEPVDTGGTYSRFFLIPKADRADREPVLGGLPEREGAGPVEGHRGRRMEGEVNLRPDGRISRGRANVHPTVKPTDLMRHLVRLVTPTGGTVLDPFLGSGTTALAAEMEGFEWVGIEREAEYIAIAEARLNGTQRGLGLETA